MRVLLKPYLVLLSVLIIASVIHTAITRDISNYLSLYKYIIPLCVFVFINAYQCEINVDKDGRTQRYYPTAKEAFVSTVFGFFLSTSISVAALSIYSSVIDFIDWVSTPIFKDYQVSLITCICIIFFSYALFLFRTYKRTLYGFTEVIVGLAISVNYATTIFHTKHADLTVVLAILTAGVYIVVRGMDNMYEGAKKESSVVLQLKNEIESIKTNFVNKNG